LKNIRLANVLACYVIKNTPQIVFLRIYVQTITYAIAFEAKAFV